MRIFLNEGSRLSHLIKLQHFTIAFSVCNCMCMELHVVFIFRIIPSNIKWFWIYLNKIARYLDKFNSSVSSNYMTSHIRACLGIRPFCIMAYAGSINKIVHNFLVCFVLAFCLVEVVCLFVFLIKLL